MELPSTKLEEPKSSSAASGEAGADNRPKKSRSVCVVVPCYNEEGVLRRSAPELLFVLDRLIKEGFLTSESFVLCVDDGSRDATWQEICSLAEENPGRVRGLRLAHNRGHQYALLAGLMEARLMADAAVSIDADLQDPPSAIEEMVREWICRGNEIVYGVRSSRKSDSWFKRNSAWAFYKIQRSMGVETVFDHADFRLMSRRALDLLSEYREQNLFLRGIIPRIGLRTSTVEYERSPRVAGESKYPFRKMLAFSIDGITSFSARPMRWILFTGLILLLCDLIVALYVFCSRTFGTVTLGWSSLILSVWFLGSLILIAIGMVGEYIGKIFAEVKGRPRYAIWERIGFDNNAPE